MGKDVPAVTGASTAARKPRDPFLDNAKVVLITLVVVGHLLENVTPSGAADGAYTWIYLFHMPAFVVLSGYLSRSFTATRKQCLSLITLLIAPYMVFQTIISIERWSMGGAFSLNFFQPNWALWYLLALAAWRLMTPLLRVIPHPLVVSIVVSVLSVTYGGISQDLSGARILSFLPFFTLGLMTTPERLERFKEATSALWVRSLSAMLLVSTFIVTYFLRDWIARRWLYMSGRESDFDMSNLELIILRCSVLLAAFVLTLAALTLIPRRHNLLTSLGAASLGVYLLHVAIVYPLKFTIGDWKGWSLFSVVGLIIAGIVLSLALASPPVQRATRWLLDPINLIGRLRRSRPRPGFDDVVNAPDSEIFEVHPQDPRGDEILEPRARPAPQGRPQEHSGG